MKRFIAIIIIGDDTYSSSTRSTYVAAAQSPWVEWNNVPHSHAALATPREAPSAAKGGIDNSRMEQEVSHVLNALVGCVAMRYAAEKSSKEITDTEVLQYYYCIIIVVVITTVVLLYTTYGTVFLYHINCSHTTRTTVVVVCTELRGARV